MGCNVSLRRGDECLCDGRIGECVPDLGQDAEEIRRQEDRMSTVQSVVSAPSQWVVTDPLANERCPKCGNIARAEWSVTRRPTYLDGRTMHGRRDEHLDMICSCGFEWERDCLDTKGEGA